jgi:hypothetical protein
MRIFTIASCLFTVTALGAQSPLPSNYKTIYSNSDVVVMHVHYGAHEFVPMHDHPSVSTIYLYLNNSGPIDIIHEDGVVAHRPPTQLGALRIAPGLAERHSVQSNSDTPSDFLRIELPHTSFPELPEIGKRVSAPVAESPGNSIVFEDASIRVSRVICPDHKSCAPFQEPSDRTLLIAVTPDILSVNRTAKQLQPGDVMWLPANNQATYTLGARSQTLLVTFLQPAAGK